MHGGVFVFPFILPCFALFIEQGFIDPGGPCRKSGDQGGPKT